MKQFIDDTTNTSSSKSTNSVKSERNDKLNHLNIKAHIESVNQEISSLDHRMENILLNKHSVTNSSDNCYRTPVDIIKKTIKKLPAIKPSIEKETEHIYETIPEDSETEPIYCSPYQGDDKNLIEKWLKINECKQKTTKQENNKNKKIIKNNSSGDDCENSSSAYNTGGSTNSNNLTLELNQLKCQFNTNDSCKNCQRHKQKSPKHQKIQQQQQLTTSNTATTHQCLQPNQGIVTKWQPTTNLTA